MSKSILVSFIVPYHNEKRELLVRCIGSILATDVPEEEREIIVIDDGSDSSLEDDIVSLSPGIKYIRQENRGQGEARNRGLDECQGEYVQFVDADDMLIASSYKHIVRPLREEKPDMIVFDYTTNESKTDACVKTRRTSGSRNMIRHNIKSPVWGYVFRRDIVDNIRFSSDTLTEDEEFTPLLMLRAKKLIVTNEKAYFYRKREESLTTTSDFSKKEKRLNDFNKSIAKLHGIAQGLEGDERKALTRRVEQLAMDYTFNTLALYGADDVFNSKTESLRKIGLYPLKLRAHTIKYLIFALVTRTSTGRRMIKHIIKNKKK